MKIHRHSARVFVAMLLLALIAGCSAPREKERRLARAEKSFGAGEFDRAKIDYQAVLRIDPENPLAIQRIGLIWSEQGSPLPALPYLKKARDLDPNDLVARGRLAAVLLALKQWEEARKEALAILERSPADGQMLRILAETVRQPEDAAEVQQALDSYPQKESADFHIAAGILAFRRNDLPAAEAELAKALASEPKSSVAHLAAGYIAGLRKEMARAREEFHLAADLAPVRSSARMSYAEFLLAAQSPDEAKAFLKEMTRQAPDYLPAWRLLAQIAAGQKDHKAALAHLEQIFARDPDDLDGRILQSNIFLAQNEVEKAAELLEKLDRAYQGRIPAVKLQVARVAVAKGNPETAEIALTQALAGNPDLAEATLALAELKIQTGQAPTAIYLLAELLKKRPDLPQSRILLAGAYQVAGQLDAARPVLEEQLKIWPSDLRAHLLLALICRRQGQADQAREALLEAARIAPGDLAVLAQIVDLDLAEENYREALARVRERMQTQPKSAPLHYLEAAVYFAQKEYDAAEAALREAFALDSNLLPAHDLLVAIYIATGRLQEAVHKTEKVVADDPTNIQAWLSLALLRENMKDFPGAAVAYEKVLAAKPELAGALNNLAYLQAEYFNQPQKAIELARRARSLDPTDPSIADTLGWALFKQGEYLPALALIQEGAEKLGDNPEAQFHLGMAYYMTGQIDGARAALQRALQLPQEFPSKEEAQRRLALLDGVGSGQGLSRDAVEKLLTAQPDDVIALMRLGELESAEGNSEAAIKAYERALQFNPNLLQATLKLAQLYAEAPNSRSRAVELAKKARALAPNDPTVLSTLGSLILQTGNFQWAYSLLQESLRLGSDSPDALHDLARSAYAFGKVTEARQLMERLLETRTSSARFEEARQFLNMTAPAAAVSEEAIDAILKAQPDDVPALMVKAGLELSRDNADKAIEIYSRVLHQFPDFAPAQKELAALYAQQPAMEPKAYDLAIQARQTLPEDLELARTLARLSFKRKEYSYAIQLFEQSAAEQPLSAKDLYFLGSAQMQANRAAEGRKTLERALTSDLELPLASEARKQLAAPE